MPSLLSFTGQTTGRIYRLETHLSLEDKVIAEPLLTQPRYHWSWRASKENLVRHEPKRTSRNVFYDAWGNNRGGHVGRTSAGYASP